jgi:hypothetical protein
MYIYTHLQYIYQSLHPNPQPIQGSQQMHRWERCTDGEIGWVGWTLGIDAMDSLWMEEDLGRASPMVQRHGPIGCHYDDTFLCTIWL